MSTTDESASSCFICSGRYVRPPSRSDRFPADLARVRPIVNVYLIWSGFDSMTVQRSAVEAFSQTTKMAPSDVECSVESAIATILNELDGIEQATALKAFVDKKDVFAVRLVW